MNYHIRSAWFPEAGFTLLELITVVAIVGIVSAMSISMYQTSMAKNQIMTETNAFLSDLALVSAEAVRTGQDVTLCASADGTSCSGSTQWNQGWIVFDDPAATQQTGNTTVIRRHQPAFSSADTFLADNSISAVSWNRGGYVSTIATNIGQVTFTDHAPTASATTTVCVAMSFLGQISTESAGQGNCK